MRVDERGARVEALGEQLLKATCYHVVFTGFHFKSGSRLRGALNKAALPSGLVCNGGGPGAVGAPGSHQTRRCLLSASLNTRGSTSAELTHKPPVPRG